MKIDVTYDGGFVHISEIMEEMISDAIAAGAELVGANAKSICPVDTGALRDSISVEHSGMSAEISANTDYASFVEFGTSKMAAQPFLVPSLLGNENAIISAIAAAITD